MIISRVVAVAALILSVQFTMGEATDSDHQRCMKKGGAARKCATDLIEKNYGILKVRFLFHASKSRFDSRRFLAELSELSKRIAEIEHWIDIAVPVHQSLPDQLRASRHILKVLETVAGTLQSNQFSRETDTSVMHHLINLNIRLSVLSIFAAEKTGKLFKETIARTGKKLYNWRNKYSLLRSVPREARELFDSQFQLAESTFELLECIYPGLIPAELRTKA